MQTMKTYSPYRHNVFENSEEGGFVKSQTERGYLLKYYPKYYHKIDLDKIDGPTITKIKGLKRLHHFAGELKFNKPHNFSLVLLQKVRKDLRTLRKISKHRNDYSHGRERWYGSKFREVKYFSGVESIEIPNHFFENPFESLDGGLKNSNRSVNRIFTYLANARNLKNIETSLLLKMPEFLVKNSNLFKKLKGKFNIFSHLFVMSSNLSQFALQSHPFSQNIIRMDISRCEIDVLKEIKTVIEALQDLKSLRIAQNAPNQTCQIPETELKQNNLMFYNALEALSKLEEFSLEVRELVLKWLNNFALPNSLQVLKVKLMSSRSIFVPPDESDSVLKNFCLRIQELPQLDTLCLGLAALDVDDHSRIWDFAINLLQGIPRLSYLRLELHSNKKEGLMDCGLIFEGIQHLTPVLRELHLDFSTGDGEITFSPSPKYRFLNLQELTITGNISFPLDIKQTLMMMMLSGKDDSMRKIKIKQQKLEIKKLMIKSQEDSEWLLKNLIHIDPIEPPIDLKLHVEFSEDLVMPLVDFIKSIRYIKGLSLYIWLEGAMRFNEVFEAIKDHHSRLDYVKVEDTEIYKQEHSYIFKKGVLIKRFKRQEDEEDSEEGDNDGSEEIEDDE